ncbi:MAG: IPT/TIG domain-containing protein [Blastocatellia bacterium]
MLLTLLPVRAQERLCDPSFEDCRQPLWTLIDAETQGIDIAFWYISDASIVNKLISRAQAGVRLRVIVDPRANPSQPSNAQYLNQIQAAGIPMRYKSSPFDSGGILHMKMALFAGQNKVEFGSANYSPYSLTTSQPLVDYTLNAVYFTDDAAIVNSFKTQFDNLWTDTTNYANYANVSGALTRHYPNTLIDPALNFPPGAQGQDYDAFATRSIAAFNQETQKIDAVVYRVTDRRFSDAMISAIGRGVTVRLLTEPDEYRNINQLWDAYHIDRMYAAGAQIKKRAHRGQTHQKSAIVYGRGLAIFGSSNWTENSSNAQGEQNYFTTKAWMFNWFVNQFESKWNAPSEYQPFVPLPPDQPVNQFPANNATGVASGAKLTWQGGPWAHKYDVYFGTTPEPPLLAADVTTGSPEDTIVETYAMPTLAPGTRYYWRVVGKTMAGQTAAGPTWSFTAGAPSGGPNVISATPARASGKGGATLQINGAGFVPGAMVTVGGAPATNATVMSTTLITATVPAHKAGAADIVVTNPDGQSARLASGFTFIEPPLLPAPTLTAIAPASGATGTPVIISGTGFTAGSTVTFDGVAAGAVTVNSYTSISAVAPAHAAGAVNVSVQTPQDQSSTLANAFTFTGGPPPAPAPTITAVSPNSGSADGGTTVTISGTGFTSGAVVTFDGAMAANVSVVNATTVSATTPPHSAGAVEVVITNRDGQSGRLANGYRYVQPPAAPPLIARVSPDNGQTAGGTSVTITGTNFVTGATVLIGGASAANVVVNSSTTISAKTPSHAAGAADVVVTNPDGQSATLAAGFTYQAPPAPAPTLSNVAPNNGPTAGGTTVMINGSGFAAGAAVKFDGIAATNILVLDSATISAKTPSHVAGPVRVVVINADGQSGTLDNAFTYVAPPPAPTVVSVSPDTGLTIGGTAMTISGTGFQAGALVKIGGATAAATSVIDTTNIRVTMPAHAAGRADVVVTNPDGQEAALRRGFTYVAPNEPPAVNITSPLNGDTLTAGTQARVRIQATDSDGSIARVEVYAGSTLIDTATASPYIVNWTPPTAGTYLLRAVATDNTGATTNSDTVTVTVKAPVEPLSLREILPASGTTLGGIVVTIHGGGFTAGARVSIGGATATNIQVINSTTLTAITPAHAAGPADVIVTTVDGQSATLAGGFSYTPPRNALPQVSITASPATGDAPLTVRFAATATDADGQIVGYRWEFGDGQSSTETAPLHIYETAGTYTARLTVMDDQGATASAALNVTAAAQAVPAMRITSATARGKKLFVFGENFAAGSVILVNGEERGTRNDEDNPPLLLIAKKGGKGIAVGQTVRVQVRTPDGKLSNEFTFTRSSE